MRAMACAARWRQRREKLKEEKEEEQEEEEVEEDEDMRRGKVEERRETENATRSAAIRSRPK